MKKIIILGIAAILFCGCTAHFMTAPTDWAFKSQLKSVPESEPHGTLILIRNHSCIYILVDNYVVFKDAKMAKASFHLTPGKHQIQA